MKPERWTRIKEIFADAQDRLPDEREAFAGAARRRCRQGDDEDGHPGE